jgi:hypothetical protein
MTAEEIKKIFERKRIECALRHYLNEQHEALKLQQAKTITVTFELKVG